MGRADTLRSVNLFKAVIIGVFDVTYNNNNNNNNNK